MFFEEKNSTKLRNTETDQVGKNKGEYKLTVLWTKDGISIDPTDIKCIIK